MYEIYLIAAFWFLASVLSTIIANRLKISMSLMEIIIGAIIGFIAFKLRSTEKLALDANWMKFCAGVAAILLTFLAGSELNPESLKSKFMEITLVGLIGFFAPFAGASLVAFYLLDAAPMVFLLLFFTKIFFKFNGLYPVIQRFKKYNDEKWYYTLLMSTGLTFGTISALYGLTNKIITQEQYTFLVGTVIASAVIPTLIANKFFLPKHLLK